MYFYERGKTMKKGQRKICIVTGTRAEYGLLYRLMRNIAEDEQLQLQLVITGMHLSPEFGLTYREIETDGFMIDAKVEMLLSSDTPVGIAKSMGMGIIGFADVLDRLQPDFIVVLGDRYEILAAAQAAMAARIPIAHIAGGDTTEGAFDEAIRHSITKMSHLHFVTNEISAKRVKQMGENPEHVFCVGSPSIDQIKSLKLFTKEELEKELNFTFRSRNILVTFHPATLDQQNPAEQFQEILDGLESFGEDLGIIFTKPNSDTYGRTLIQMIDEYVAKHPRHTCAYTNLGQKRYFSVIEQMDAVLGNSSSGIYEVPSFKKVTINVGERQKGRIQVASIINCLPEKKAVIDAIKHSFTIDCSDVVNPYGDGTSSKKILSILKSDFNRNELIKKHFFEVDCSK
ncbi:MAG: UDP-N-acetylglucosamine 2-epimerase [Firmicutes bacterium]|nr:UDP-N-acetylglucosamine 2-epimerase [Bacillota bacterium]